MKGSFTSYRKGALDDLELPARRSVNSSRAFRLVTVYYQAKMSDPNRPREPPTRFGRCIYLCLSMRSEGPLGKIFSLGFTRSGEDA